jgi:hypothetical protein
MDKGRKKLPEELTPINLLAFFEGGMNFCGCYEFQPAIKEIQRILEWCASDIETRQKYTELYPDVGVFYLMMALLDSGDGMDLIEHGCSVRYPWLTADGSRLLEALKIHPVPEIQAAQGTAYDGFDYGHL